MYYDDYDKYDDDKEYDEISSRCSEKVEKTIDTIGFSAVGGIGQLIYHLFKFKGYELEYDNNGSLIARPICDEYGEPEFYTNDSPTGTELFVNMYNLAKKINDFSEEKSHTELIMDWCRTVAHPYAVDFIFDGLYDKHYDAYISSGLLIKDGIFSINDFMRDLEKFYHAASMYFAIEEACLGSNDIAKSLYMDGRHFSGIPFFEKFRGEIDENVEYIENDPDDFDIVEEMNRDLEAEQDVPEDEIFVTEPYDHIAKLQKILVDMVPEFKIGLKINPRTQRTVFAADIKSVFDICWYTLARKISEDVAPIDRGKEPEKPYGVVLTCPYCGDAFVRRSNRAVTCGKPECHKARKRMNQQNSRKQRKIKEIQN